jgi:hypothetical protein
LSFQVAADGSVRQVAGDDQMPGGLGHLAAISPTVRRLCLEMTDRHADAIAAVLADPADRSSLATAKVHAIALAWVFQTITDESGRRSLQGQHPVQIADEVRRSWQTSSTSWTGGSRHSLTDCNTPA